jgi:hypothetical protein
VDERFVAKKRVAKPGSCKGKSRKLGNGFGNVKMERTRRQIAA